MNLSTAIPPEFQTLISLLRGAVNQTPPADDLHAADWPTVLKQARQQGVDTFLYPYLAEHGPDLFSAHAAVADTSAPAAWRALFLDALSLTLRRQRQLAELLSAFALKRLDVIPLKGAWLSEKVYDDPAQRGMSDLDLLIRADDRDASHALFLALGYEAESNVLHSGISYDQAYRHTARPHRVEMHWHVNSELTPDQPTPDMAAIWQRTSASTLLGHPTRQLAPEDQLSHLIQHIFHHAFAMHLRGYLDIALLLKRQDEGFAAASLASAASDWQIGHALSFVLGFVSELFALPLPPALAPLSTAGRQDSRQTLALQILSTLPPAHARGSASMQARLKRATPYERLSLVLSRVFMPRTFLAHTYPCARSVFGVPLAWLFRARDVYARHHTEYTVLLKPSSRGTQNLTNAEMREELARRLLDGTK